MRHKKYQLSDGILPMLGFPKLLVYKFYIYIKEIGSCLGQWVIVCKSLHYLSEAVINYMV